MRKGRLNGPAYWDWEIGPALNHPDFFDDSTGSYEKSPAQSLTGAGFESILAANDPRIIELAPQR